jgi:hypothetical protein
MLLSNFIKRRAKIFYKKIEYYEDKSNHEATLNKLNIPYAEKYFILEKIDDISNVELPDNCVIKFNNLASSKGIIFRKNGRFNNNFSLNQVIIYLKNNSKQNPLWPISMKNIKQKVIIEELLIPSDNILYDIKCYVFNGIVNHTAIINPNKRAETYTIDKDNNRVIYDPRDSNNIKKSLPKIKYLNEIIELANKIAIELFSDTFLRIDFYSTTKGPMFGEFTFNPNNGGMFTKEADKILGKLCGSLKY